MRLIDGLGTVGLPGTLPTGNLVWVDGVSGNDSLAGRGRLGAAFKTLTAAKTAASSGDTIAVMPSTYNEGSLLKNNVNWFFLPGAVINLSSGTIFDTGGAAITTFIAGHGEFIHGAASGNVLHVTSGSSSCNIIIQGKRIQSSGTAIKVAGSTSTVRLEVLQDIKATSTAIDISGSGSNTIVRAHTVEVTGSTYGVLVNGGSLDLESHKVLGATMPAIKVSGGTGDVIVRAYEIYSSGRWPVEYSASTYFPKLTLIGARIKSGSTTANYKYAINITTDIGGDGHVRLANCLLLPGASEASIKGAYTGTGVQISGHSVTKNAVDTTNITVFPSTILTQDGNVQ